MGVVSFLVRERQPCVPVMNSAVVERAVALHLTCQGALGAQGRLRRQRLRLGKAGIRFRPMCSLPYERGTHTSFSGLPLPEEYPLPPASEELKAATGMALGFVWLLLFSFESTFKTFTFCGISNNPTRWAGDRFLSLLYGCQH